jgi:hypothetical protein
VKYLKNYPDMATAVFDRASLSMLKFLVSMRSSLSNISKSRFRRKFLNEEQGDVPGWVLVVLMTTGSAFIVNTPQLVGFDEWHSLRSFGVARKASWRAHLFSFP